MLYSGTVKILYGDTGRNIFTYQSNADQMRSTSWSPDGSRIVSGDGNGMVRIWMWNANETMQEWNATTRQPLAKYQCPLEEQGPVDSAWSPDGTHIVSACWSGTVQIWDASTGHAIVAYTQPTSHVGTVTWSPDGKSIAQIGGALNDTTVQVWNAATGRLIFTYSPQSDLVDFIVTPGGSHDINAIVWSADSSRIASATNDGKVQVWDAYTGNNTITYSGHIQGGFGYPVDALAWYPFGNRVASAGNDDTVQIWEVK